MTVATTFDQGDLRRADPKFKGARYRQYLAAVERLSTFAREHFGRSVLALAVRWVLDQGPTIALWGARRPDQLAAVREIEGWRIDEAAKRQINAILTRCILDPISPQFMAPPEVRPTEQALAVG
jgi:aryl-alcohol dehydrogenase-like predicted oxidoreductase